MIDERAILEVILREYSLPAPGPHGVLHWARVRGNGRRLAEAMGADGEVSG